MFVKLLKIKMFRNSIMMEIQEKTPDDFFKGIKLSLKSVLKHPDINTPKITNAVIMCNKIVINVLLFMKLYLLDYYETHNTLPVFSSRLHNILIWCRISIKKFILLI